MLSRLITLAATGRRPITGPRLRRPARRLDSRLALGLAACLAFSAGAQAHTEPAGPPAEAPGRLEVTAQHTLNATPDMATLTASLWERTPARPVDAARETSPEAMREARAQLESRMAELIRTLEAEGLPREAIRAGSLSVQPQYVQGPDNDEGQPQRRVRTQLTRPITLTLEDLEALPGLLDALTGAGVDSLDGVSYDLKDRSAASDRALGLAIERARAKATLMAERLDITLGRVVEIKETQQPSFQPQMMMRSADAMPKESAAEYRPGQIEIEAGVSIHWRIAD